MKSFLAKHIKMSFTVLFSLLVFVSFDKDAFRHLSNAAKFFKLKMYEYAIVELKNTSRLLQNDEYFRNTYYREVLFGIVSLKEGNNQSSMDFFEKALKKEPSLVQIRFILCMLYVQNKFYQKAVKLFDGHEEYGGKELVQGIRYYYDGNYTKAAAMFSAVLSKLEDELIYFDEVATGEDIAITIVKEAVYSLLARAFFDINDIDNAITYYSKVLSMNPQDYFAQVNLKILLLKRNLKEIDNRYFAFSSLAYQYSLLELYPQTIYYYKKSLETKSDYFPAVIGLADVYESAGSLKLAKKYYLRAAKLANNPQQRSKIYIALAGIAIEHSDIDMASMWIEKALLLAPTNEIAISNKQQFYLLGKYRQGKATAREKLKLARSYKEQKDYYSALKYELESLEQENVFAANLQIADTYYKLQRYDRAEYYYQQSLAKNRNSFQVFSGLALVCVEKNHYVAAIDYMQKALKLNKKDLLLQHRIAQIYFEAGINSLAVSHWKYVCRHTKDESLKTMLNSIINIIG